MKLVDFGIGIVAGAATSFLLWKVFSVMLDRQFDAAAANMISRGEAELHRALQTAIDTDVPNRVRETIDQRLAAAGITAATGARLDRALTAAERAGLFGLQGIPVRGRA